MVKKKHNTQAKTATAPKPMGLSKSRIGQLDGLRGVAIVMVVLNHLRWGPLFDVLPAFLRPVLGSIVGGGKTGVLILFLLSGFLMATLYPVLPTWTSKVAFWQKRYARIFPAFLTMCVGMFIARQYWEVMPGWSIITIIAAIVTWVGLGWRWMLARPDSPQIEHTTTKAFWLIQASVAVGYIALQATVPSAVFYQLWPTWASQLVFFLTNATMTLPLGVFAPQLDGVYWSVAAEVLFYLLYPGLVLPLVDLVLNRGKGVWRWLCLGLLFPFFYGLTLLFKSVLGLGMLEIYMAMYFVLGVVMGKLFALKDWQKVTRSLSRVPAWSAITIGVMGIWGLGLVQNYSSPNFIVMTLGWSVPLVLVFCLTLQPTNAWSRLMNWSVLRLLGRVSYALYLTHTVSIEIWAKHGAPETIPQMVLMGGGAIATMALLTALVHHYLEVPYFSRKKVPSVAIVRPHQQAKKIKLWQQFISRFSIGPVGVITAIVLILVWVGYRVPVSLAARVTSHHDAQLADTTVLTTRPVAMSFHSQSTNLGMILLHLQPLSDGQVGQLGLQRGGEAEGAVRVVVKDGDEHILAANDYPMYQLFASRFHPVGLPLITDSNDKDYAVEVSVTSDKTAQKIALIQDGIGFRTVAVFTKQDLLTQPLLTAQILAEKLIQPLQEKEAQKILLACAPILLSLYVLSRKNAFKR